MQLGIHKVRLAEEGRVEVCLGEVRPHEVRSHEARLAEVHSSEIHFGEVRVVQLRILEVRAPEVRLLEVRARRTSGSSCQIASSNPTTTSSITAVTPGPLSSPSRGRSCQSGSAIGPTSVDQFEDWYYMLPFAADNAASPRVCRAHVTGLLPLMVQA